MDSLLWAAVLTLAATVLLNLVLTLAVIRRLRSGATTTPTAHGPGAGDAVPAFAVTMTDDEQVTERDLLAGPATIVFALPGCAPCTRTLAELTGAEPTFVFVMGEPGEPGAEAVLAKVPPFARAAVTPLGGPIGRAFGVEYFPTTLRIADGVIQAVDNGVPARARV